MIHHKIQTVAEASLRSIMVNAAPEEMRFRFHMADGNLESR